MGIEVVVESEFGEKLASLHDPTNIVRRILPDFDDPTFQCLNRVDWYGNTVFNRYQVPVVRQELTRLAAMKRSAEELEVIRQLDALAVKSVSEPHLYLKFYGD